MTAMNKDKYFTRVDLAKHFHFEMSKIYNLIESGDLVPDIVVGRIQLFDKEKIRAIDREQFVAKVSDRNGERSNFEPPTPEENKLLVDYVLGRRKGRDIMKDKRFKTRQNVSLYMQNIAYRKFYFYVKDKADKGLL